MNLKGLEAISFYHGWSIAVTGIFIVFTALVTLSFVLSQLHKLLIIWEKKDDLLIKTKRMFSRQKKTAAVPKVRASRNFKESARQINLLVKSLKDPFFSLPRLVMLAKKVDISNPHSTVNALLQSKVIMPDEKGFFYWDETTYKHILEKE